MKYYQVTITPCSSGFGEYQADSEGGGDEWDSLSALELESSDIEERVLKLGDQDLPDEIEDIRGKIHNEPEHIYAFIDEQGIVRYYGIREGKS